MNQNNQQVTGVASCVPWIAPVANSYCSAGDQAEVLALTGDWEHARDVSPIYRLVREAKMYGLRLVREQPTIAP